MTENDSHSFIKDLNNRKSPNVNFKCNPQTDETLLSITCGSVGVSHSLNVMKMSFDTIVR